MFENYIFDLYDIIIDVKIAKDQETVWEKMSLLYGYMGAHYETDEFRKKYLKYINKMMNIKASVKHPEIDIQDVFYKLYNDKGVRPKKKLVKETAITFSVINTESVELRHGVKKTLEGLKAKDKHLYILSNGQSIYANAQMKYLDIKQYFDGIYMSSEYGMGKPAEAFLNTLTEEENLKKKATVMISKEDSKDDILAKAVGIDYRLIGNKEEKGKQKQDAYIGDILELL